MNRRRAKALMREAIAAVGIRPPEYAIADPMRILAFHRQGDTVRITHGCTKGAYRWLKRHGARRGGEDAPA